MNTNDVRLLTAEMAGDVNLLSTFGKVRALDVRFALDAIATERARVCPVRTEAEWLRKFEHEWDHFGIGERYHHSKDVWLAFARHLKLIAEK